MAQKLEYKHTTCPRCEGTGHEINWFDPPLDPFDGQSDCVFSKDESLTTLNGREILKETCEACNGKGYLSSPKYSLGASLMEFVMNRDD